MAAVNAANAVDHCGTVKKAILSAVIDAPGMQLKSPRIQSAKTLAHSLMERAVADEKSVDVFSTFSSSLIQSLNEVSPGVLSPVNTSKAGLFLLM